MKLPSFSAGLADLVQGYHSHLIHAQGLAIQTCAQKLRYVRRFLRAYAPRLQGRLSFGKLSAGWLLDYVLQLSASVKPQTLRCHTGAVRSLLRYLTLTGRVAAGLEWALPPSRAPRPHRSQYLSAAQLQALLHAFDRRRAAGVRDYAMALLAARLGLRAKEIAQLTLEDIDWRAAILQLHQTKGRRSRLLPLPAAVGYALAQYLRRVRFPSPARQVFLCLYRLEPLSASSVSDAIVAGFRRAGLKVLRPGPHLLRHTLASHLVQKGSDLKAIADLLGHRDLNTTTIYAKVNRPMLAQVAQPWPKQRQP